MFKIIKIGCAFIGVIVGAGFASGQEILQYFTSFGYMGAAAAAVSTALFAFLGMSLTKTGSRLQTLSHKKAIYTISGLYLGFIVDVIIVFTLFGVGVVMVAGAGSSLNQQFGLPVFVGSLLLAIFVVLAMMLKVEKVIAIIGSITPFLLATIIGIAVYSLLTMEGSFSELNPIALEQEKSFPNWFISGVNYASFNIAVGAGMAIVMGGAEKDERTAALGGLVGGLGIGVLIVLAHFAIFSQVDVVAAYDLPLLSLVNEISPILGFIMSVILFGMIFNTGLGMFYGFVARFFEPGTRNFFIASIITLAIGFIASFVGFTDLVAKVYSTIGYLGLFLIIVLLYAPIRLKKLGINKREVKKDGAL